jgi:energy-coupling factor transporter ATP-binding protein EcfA2
MNFCNTNLERSQVIKQIRIYKCCVGLISHSSSIYYNKTVFLFPGMSGVGKSTIARKLSGIMTPINDDRNLLEFADNKVIVRSDFSEDNCLPGRYIINNDLTGILKAVLFPVKEYERDSFIEPLTDKGLIWRKLLTCVAPPAEGLDHLFPNYYAMIDRLMDLVPFFNFHHNLKDSPEYIANTIRLTI